MEDDQVIEPQEPTEPEASEPTEEIEGAEPSEPAEPLEPAEPAKKENRVQARIDEITREKYAAKQEAEYWKKVATGEIKAPQPEPKQVATIPGLPTEPNQDDFEDWNDYNKALAIWGGKVALAEQEFRTKAQKQQETRQTVFQNHAERERAAKERYPDFDEVIALAPDIRFNDSTFDAILESDASADLKYYFSAEPEEAARINALSPVQQIKEIAKLESKFTVATPQPVKRTTQAPAPINAIGENDSGLVDESKMTDKQWIAHERKRLAAMGRKY